MRWCLFGAQAALLYGAARLTADVDVTVRLGARDTAELVRALENAGFRLRVRDVADFVAKTRACPCFTSIGNAVRRRWRDPGLEELFFRRLRRRIIDGVRVPVASPGTPWRDEGARRAGKDEDDVVAILAAQPKLNLERVRETLDALERALDQSDLRPRFEALLVRARRPSSRGIRNR